MISMKIICGIITVVILACSFTFLAIPLTEAKPYVESVEYYANGNYQGDILSPPFFNYVKLEKGVVVDLYITGYNPSNKVTQLEVSTPFKKNWINEPFQPEQRRTFRISFTHDGNMMDIYYTMRPIDDLSHPVEDLATTFYSQ